MPAGPFWFPTPMAQGKSARWQKRRTSPRPFSGKNRLSEYQGCEGLPSPEDSNTVVRGFGCLAMAPGPPTKASSKYSRDPLRYRRGSCVCDTERDRQCWCVLWYHYTESRCSALATSCRSPPTGACQVFRKTCRTEGVHLAKAVSHGTHLHWHQKKLGQKLNKTNI